MTAGRWIRLTDAAPGSVDDVSGLGDARGLVAAVPGQQDAVRRITAFIDAHADALHRSCAPGHLTASAAVLDHGGVHTCLLHHVKLGRWLQPGGHADGDGDLARVALKEADEETGIAGLWLWSRPVDLDVHRVAPPHEEPHDHLDARFVAVAPPGAVPVGNHESHAVRWVALTDLDEYALDPGTHRLLARARDLQRATPVPREGGSGA